MTQKASTRPAEIDIPVIAHIIYRLNVGGLENGLVNIINALPGDSYRHVVICLTRSSQFKDRIRKKNVEIYELEKRQGKDWFAYVKLWRLLRKIRPRIVHTRNLAAIDCAIVAAFAGVPIRIHGEHGRDIGDLEGKSRKYKILRRICAIFIQLFIPMSRDLNQWLINDIGISGVKIRHIYNGVDTSRFLPIGSGKDRGKAVSKDHFVIGYVGRLEPVKNPLLLLQAFSIVQKKESNDNKRLQLTVIGDGPLMQQLAEYVKNSHLEKQVSLLGNRDNIEQLLSDFDIFVLPSLAEGISNTILEAMACGLPVVATKVGGNYELVVNAETGYLVASNDPAALADAIQKYLDDPDLRIKQGRVARSRIEKYFSMDKMVEQYKEVYDKHIVEKINNTG